MNEKEVYCDCIDNGNVTLKHISFIEQLDKRFEEGRKQGAKDELESELVKLNKEFKVYERQVRVFDLRMKEYAKGMRDKTSGLIKDYEKRLAKLKECVEK